MTYVVYVGGQKGGSGKTTTSHLLCLGSILHGQPAAYVLTDPQRTPKTEGRPYGVMDGRDPRVLAGILTSSAATGNGWLVIDGGGNRQAFDDAMAGQADLTIVPFRDSEEDLEAAAKDMRLKHSYAYPAAWPSNAKAQAATQCFLDAFERQFPGRLIRNPGVFVHSVYELLGQSLQNPSTPVRSAAKAVFREIAELVAKSRPVEQPIELAVR